MDTNRNKTIAVLGFCAGTAVLAFSAIPRHAAAQTPQEQQAPPPPAAPAPDTPASAAPAATPADAQTSPVVIKKESRLVLVDAVVTDKKGNYVRDLTDKDFKIYEDNKEQPVASFSSGADISVQAKGQKHYLILFFDNSSMAAPDQIQARGAAAKFVLANSGPDRMMAVV